MEEIKQIYDKLDKFLSEIIITPIPIKDSNEIGEDDDGQPYYEYTDSILELFNYGPYHLFKRELNTILSATEGLLKESIDLKNIKNRKEIVQIIAGLIRKIESRETFIIEYENDKVNIEGFQVSEWDISAINDILIKHRNCVWDTMPSTNNLMKEEKIQNSPLIWRKSKTDLIELVTALHYFKSINDSENNPPREQAMEIFSQLFNIDLKNADSLLSHATDRGDGSPFLKSLSKSFDDYEEGLSKKQEERYKGRTKF